MISGDCEDVDYQMSDLIDWNLILIVDGVEKPAELNQLNLLLELRVTLKLIFSVFSSVFLGFHLFLYSNVDLIINTFVD